MHCLFNLQAEFSKKRTCTFGLHGPWGESTSVFIRISFTFPRDYPHASHPGGTPQVELERNPLIPVKSRVLILRRLRTIREQQRPCLEACLKFLLYGDSDDDDDRPSSMDDSESSDDDVGVAARRSKDGAMTMLRSDKNLAEPRTSQGVFGPNGEMVTHTFDSDYPCLNNIYTLFRSTGMLLQSDASYCPPCRSRFEHVSFSGHCRSARPNTPTILVAHTFI